MSFIEALDLPCAKLASAIPTRMTSTSDGLRTKKRGIGGLRMKATRARVLTRFLRSAAFIGGSLLALGAPALAADECTRPDKPIETDRPDTTNSSTVVPFGSLQNENGINKSRLAGSEIFDGTNSRWRLGVTPCFEALIDLPNYVGTLRGAGDPDLAT